MEDYNYILQLIRYCITNDLGCKDYKLNEEGNVITFEYRDVSFVCLYEKEDPYYVRILIPNIDTLNEQTSIQTYQQLLALNARFKTGKFILVDGALWISAEVMLSGNTRISPVIFSLVNMLVHMREDYARYIIEQTQPQENK